MSLHENPSSLIPDRQSRATGRISLVGAGPGAVDLMTLRAIRCLAMADAVFHDRLVDPAALDLVRPGVACVYVGKAVGAHSWPQDRINATIVAAALEGKHVVRLKSGDPSIFGRAAEEIAAARAHGIGIDIIPGITAASAAAAMLCEPLTERGKTDRLVLATATGCSGALPPRISEVLRPGTTVVFYMAMRQLQQLSDHLIAAGLSGDQPVMVASDVSLPTQHSLRTTLCHLAAECRAAGIGNPAVIVMKIAAMHPVAGALARRVAMAD